MVTVATRSRLSFVREREGGGGGTPKNEENKMKVQKLGLVLGMNMAVACLMMQGCKANPKGGTSSLPPDTTVVAPAPEGTAQTTPSTTLAASAKTGPSATASATPGSAAVPTGVTIEPPPAGPTSTPSATVLPPAGPSSVPEVKRLPPPGVKPLPPPPKRFGSAGTPTPSAQPGPTGAAAGGFTYTVKAGDQLGVISRRYNVRLAAIAKANPGLNPDRIRIGQKIVIPGVAGPSATAVATAASATVPAGTTTVKDVKTVNAASPVAAANTVPPVKTKPAFKPYTGATTEYTVKSGDSLGKIAHENGTSIRTLKELNKLTKDNVRIGQKLLVPKAAEGKVKTAEKEAGKATAQVKQEPKKLFEKKDPVEKTAAAAPATTPEVKEEDAKKPQDAEKPVEKPADPAQKPGEAAPGPAQTDVAAPAPVQVPAEQPKVEEAPAQPAAGATYTVKDGDDLVSVSIACGISPSQLMDLNGLKAGDAIKPGQKLKIPANAKPTEE